MIQRSRPYQLPLQDLDLASDAVGGHWRALDGMTLFFTGGTGFVGLWMTSVLLRAIDRGLLSAGVRLLTRSKERIQGDFPEIAAHPSVELVHGDVLADGWDCHGCTHLIAGATDARASLLRDNPKRMFETILNGTCRTLDKAKDAGISRALLISSGAVNGPQTPETTRVHEDQFFGFDSLKPGSAYAEGKRAAEQLFVYEGLAGLSFSVARLWAFVGPLLPLDQHFAIGNFIGDALEGRRICVKGDGSTVRSYQYAADMAAWCWSILADGENGQAYNVGSDDAVTMGELAVMCAQLGNAEGVDVLGGSGVAKRPDIYVPSVELPQSRLGLRASVSLTDAITRTLDWHRSRNSSLSHK